MSYVRRNVVVGAPVAQTYERDNRSVVWSRHISPVAIMSLIAGAIFLIVGVVALLRGDMQGSLTDPMVKVAGLDHTPALGLIEIAIGVILMLGGADRSRSTIIFMGSALVVFGIILVIQSDSLHDDLGVTAAHGWWAVLIGAILLLGAFLLPTLSRQHVVASTAQLDDVTPVATTEHIVQTPTYAPPTTPVVVERPVEQPPVIVEHINR
jgi:hypothetical protein